MAMIRWAAAAVAAMTVIAAAACGGDEGDDGGDAPAIVQTATALASSPTTDAGNEGGVDRTREAAPTRVTGSPFTADEAPAFLEYTLLQPDDLSVQDWVVQSDEVTDNDAAAAATPDGPELVARCGRLLGRTITNFPPDSVAAFFNGTTLAYFSQGTLYETVAGAQTCADAAATRLAQPGELARTFGGVFTNPDGVIVEPVPYEPIGDGAFAAKLTGQTDAGGTSIDLTILVVSFRDGAATFAVGMAVSGIEPPMEELQPYVDLVLQRSQEFQQQDDG